MTAQSKKDLSWQFYLLQLPFWSALVLLVTATLLVIGLRFLVPKIDLLRPHLETWLNERLPFEVEISQLKGSLFKIDPVLGFDKLTLTNQGENFLVIEEVYFELDTLASLMAWAPRMKDARLDGLELWLEETNQGWQLKGWQEQSKPNKTDEIKAVEANLPQLIGYLELLLVQGELNFSDLRLNFEPLNDAPLFLSANSMTYLRWLKGRQFSFQLESSTATTQPAELVITLEGEVFNTKTSKLSAWFNFPLVGLDDFQSLWPNYFQEDAKNIEGHFSVEGWLSLDQGQAKLDLQARNVELVRSDRLQVEFGAADLTLEGDLSHWSADWKISNLKSSHYFFNELSGRVGQEEQTSYFQLEELKLDPLTLQLAKDEHLPDGVRELIDDLKPGGSLINLLLTQGKNGELELQANLKDVKIAAWRGAPLGGGLNGWLQADAKGGQVVFADHELQLGFPNLYTPVWNFSKAKGEVRWELEDQGLWVIGENLAVTLPVNSTPASSVNVSGDFAYFYGLQDQRFYLNLGLLPVDVAAHQQLVPDKLLEPQLLEWLNAALMAGKVNQAGFIYAGSIGHNAAFQLVTDFSATDFKFQPDWPHLSQAKGRVQVSDAWIKGQVVSAKLGQGQLTKASFAAALGDGDAELEVTTKIKTTLEFFPWLVKNSPLKTQIPTPLHEWIYSGQMQGDLSLTVPLTATEQLPSVKLQSQINQGQLTLSQIDLKVNDINGPLNFTLDKGLESSGLTGKIRSQPVKVLFINEPESYLSFSAGLAAEDLKQHFHLPKSLDLTGITQVKGNMPLAPFGVLEVTSTLEGFALTTPLPWNKKASEKRNFTMQLDFAAKESPLRIKLADQLDFLTHLDNPARGSRLELAEQAVTKAVLPEEAGLSVAIQLKDFNAEPTYSWFKQFSLNESKQLPATVPLDQLQGFNQLAINVDQLSWKDFNVGQLNFTLQNSIEGLKLDFLSPLSGGNVWWPVNSNEQPEIVLNYLHFPAEDEKPETEEKTSKRADRPLIIDPLADFDPKSLPAALVEIKDFRLGKKHLGHFTAQIKPVDEGVELNPLQVNLEQSELSVRFKWLINELGPSSQLKGSLVGKDLGLAFKALTGDVAASVVSAEHKLYFKSSWPGSPLAFDLHQAKGELQLELKDGYFPKTDSSLSGVSQVIGLLNMDTLLRRLRLDFSDLTAKGVSFNTIKGKYVLEEGYLRTTEPTKMQSSATRLSLTGEIDLIEKTLQQELLIVLPVAQSLPLAAVLAGAPQVGAAIWVVQKVFSDLFDSFTEARYTIEGPFDKPKIELKRVF